MNVDLTKLPISIQRQLPMSLRSYKDIHVLEELPVAIQYLIRNYFEKQLSVTYNISYDVTPDISKYSDFTSIDNLIDLVVEYIKNYLIIVPESYPFDPTFGCRLKYQIQTRDLTLRQTLITTEINNIVNVIKSELGAKIIVDKISIVPVSIGPSTEYNCTILLKINDTYTKQLTIDFMG